MGVRPFRCGLDEDEAARRVVLTLFWGFSAYVFVVRSIVRSNSPVGVPFARCWRARSPGAGEPFARRETIPRAGGDTNGRVVGVARIHPPVSRCCPPVLLGASAGGIPVGGPMRIDESSRRWRDALPYLRALPVGEKRRFYAQAVKFFTNESRWDESLRDPSHDDPVNMRDMLVAFNDQTHSIMTARALPDVRHQWQVVAPIRRGMKRRKRKKQLSRFTYEMMRMIRSCHPARRVNGARERGRVHCMARFQREVKSRFL